VRDDFLLGGVADTASVEDYYVGGVFVFGFLEICG